MCQIVTKSNRKTLCINWFSIFCMAVEYNGFGTDDRWQLCRRGGMIGFYIDFR